MAYFVLCHVLFLYCAFTLCSSGFATIKIGPKPIWNATHTDKLRQDLLLNYDKFARPAQHYNTTTLRFGMTIVHIELNELKSTLTVSSFLRMVWTDEKFKWNESDYGGLSVLHLAEHEIWQPDIFLYNSATSTPLHHFGNHYCLVYPNGEVLWVPSSQFSVLCSLNLKYWPFDTQKCHMDFGSWTSHGDLIDIQLYNNQKQVELELHSDNGEWKITEAVQYRNEIYYKCCKEPYIKMVVNITLSRISPAYRAIVVTPATVVAVLTLLSFWLPPGSGEKIVLNGCTAIIISIFMLYFAQKLPAMASHVPLIVLFYSHTLYVVVFSMIGSVFVITLTRMKHTCALPWIIKQPLTGKLGKWLGLHHYINQATVSIHRETSEEMRDHQVTDFDDSNSGEEHHIMAYSTTKKPTFQHDWVLLAAAVDRICFVFFCFLFIVLSIVYAI